MKKKVLDLYNKLCPSFTVDHCFLSNCEKKIVLFHVTYQFLMRQSLTTIRLKVDGISGVVWNCEFHTTWLDIWEGRWTLVWYGMVWSMYEHCSMNFQRDRLSPNAWSSTWSDYGDRREENKKSLGSTKRFTNWSFSQKMKLLYIMNLCDSKSLGHYQVLFAQDF